MVDDVGWSCLELPGEGAPTLLRELCCLLLVVIVAQRRKPLVKVESNCQKLVVGSSKSWKKESGSS